MNSYNNCDVNIYRYENKDQQSEQTQQQRLLVFTRNAQSTSYINYFLKWNNISIEQNLRTFMTNFAYNRGFVKWNNINRNLRYKKQQIISIGFYLSDILMMI